MSGRRLLITGASRGIGRALVDHYLELGDSVIGCARGDSSCRHERYTHALVDVTDDLGVRTLFADARARLGGLDGVINNAGTASMNALALTSTATVRKVVETNLIGTFIMMREAIRLLRLSPAGRIVNVSTIAVPLRLEGEAVYAASKSAVETLTRIASRELAPFGITCNAVGPSVVKSDLTAGVPPDRLEKLLQRQAQREYATPGDVANVIDFFLRPESRLVTGQVVYLAGCG